MTDGRSEAEGSGCRGALTHTLLELGNLRDEAARGECTEDEIECHRPSYANVPREGTDGRRGEREEGSQRMEDERRDRV